MKRRNKYFLKEKECLKLERELDVLYHKRHNLEYVLLDKPIQDGYLARLVLRDDISNRADAHIFQEMIDYLGTTSYAKKEKYFDWFNRSGLVISRCYEKPHLNEISEDIYNNLQPNIKKWFSKSTHFGNTWCGMKYYSNVPSFFFEIKIEKRFINKVKLVDTILLQEEAEIEKVLDDNYYHQRRTNQFSNAPKAFRKNLNRGRRTDSKRKLKKIFGDIDLLDNIDIIFDDNYKDANWRFW